MALTKKDVDRIAELSMLEIDSESFPKLAADMENIIGMVDTLEKLNVELVTDIDLSGNYNMLRADEPTESVSRQEALKNAPEERNGCFFVPKIVE